MSAAHPTLSEMQSSGSNAYVARLLAEGLDVTDVIRRLRARFRGVLDTSAYPAYFAGRAAFNAGQNFSSLAGNERIRAAGIPDSGTGRRGWRYYITVGFSHPNFSHTQYRTTQVYSQSSLTHAAVYEMARTQALLFVGQSTGRDDYLDLPAQAQIESLNTLAIERD